MMTLFEVFLCCLTSVKQESDCFLLRKNIFLKLSMGGWGSKIEISTKDPVFGRLIRSSETPEILNKFHQVVLKLESRGKKSLFSPDPSMTGRETFKGRGLSGTTLYFFFKTFLK